MYRVPLHHLFAKYWYDVRMNIWIHFHCDVPRTIFSYLVPGAVVVVVVVEKMIRKGRKQGTTYRDKEGENVFFLSRNQGTKKSKKIVLKASVVTKFPVSATKTKPSRGPCHTICHLLPALVGNGTNFFGGWWWFWKNYCTCDYSFYTTTMKIQ